MLPIFARVFELHFKPQSEALQGVPMALVCGIGTSLQFAAKEPVRLVEFREVINAVRHLARSGCGWRMLPVHFGHWRTVYGWFRELARRFLFQTIHDLELMLDRERQGREPGFHAHDAARQLLESLLQRTSLDLTPEGDLAIAVKGDKVKDILADVDSDD